MARPLAVVGEVASAVGLVLLLPFVMIAIALPVVLVVRIILLIASQF